MSKPPPPDSIRSARHHAAIVSDRQAARMRSGRTESVPEDYGYIRISPLDAQRRAVRLALEDRKLAREVERMTGSSYQ